MSGPRIFLVAGEPSGDLHGSRLADELKRQAPDCCMMGIGGPKMEAAGVQLIYSQRDFAFLGFSEVLTHLPFILRVFRQFKRLFASERPDLVILIDYPGFNIRLAKIAKKKAIPVLYYISPQIWAWRPQRAHAMARWVDRLAVVLPFEREFYRQRTGLHPHFVGHPLLEVVGSNVSRAEFCDQWNLDPERPILGLLPGSRSQEVRRILPTMLTAGRLMRQKLPRLQVAVGAISAMPEGLYGRLIGAQPGRTRLVQDRTYDLMRHAHLLLVASGTATLEAAIMGTPMIVLYRVSLLSWLLALLLVRVPYIGLVNLVSGDKIVPELVQYQATAARVASQAMPLMEDSPERGRMIEALSKIRHLLGTEGASRRTAELALGLIQEKG